MVFAGFFNRLFKCPNLLIIDNFLINRHEKKKKTKDIFIIVYQSYLTIHIYVDDGIVVCLAFRCTC